MKSPRGGKRTSAAGPTPPTQLLQKIAGRLTGDNILLIGVPRDEAVAGLFGRAPGVLVTFDYGACRLFESSLAGGALQPQFTAHYSPGRVHDLAVMYLQKGTESNDLVAAMASRAVRPGGTLFLVGENKAGIRSAADLFERRAGAIVSSEHARHSVVYETRVDDSLTGAVDLRDWEREYSVETGGQSMSLVSLPGVFSHGRLDGGTRFLLDHLPGDLAGDVLDFGCGSGVIGAAVKTRFPGSRVTLADSNAFALESAARTFARNGLEAAGVTAVDIFEGIDRDFDLIISNPPFHQGIATNYDIVSSFLSACDRHLRPGGRVLLVANAFLPYEGLMARALAPPLVVAQDQQYKVLASRKRS